MGLVDRTLVYLILLGYTLAVAAILIQHPVRTLGGNPPVRALAGATGVMLVAVVALKIVLAAVGRARR